MSWANATGRKLDVPADNVPYTGCDMYKGPLLACRRNQDEGLDSRIFKDSPSDKPDATENAKPTDLVKRVLAPRYPWITKPAKCL